MTGAVVLAHAGGAPEALTIGLPLVIFIGFMYAEKRARARERLARERGELPEAEEPPAPPP